MILFHCVVTIFLLSQASATFQLPTPYIWQCEINASNESVCVKYMNDGLRKGTTLRSCKLTCGPHGMLWPKPSMVEISKDVVKFHPSNLQYNAQTCHGEICQLLSQAFTIFKNNLYQTSTDYDAQTKQSPFKDISTYPQSIGDKEVMLRFDIHMTNDRITLHTDESYSINIKQINNLTDVYINASTYFGARHALETLSQLIDYCELEDSLQIVSNAAVHDEPAYRYRGILLDTSRNFFSVDDIKRTLDGMAANKLNTFHWHITDSHSFPMKLNSLPNMVYYGAYSPNQIYEPHDIREIVEYGRVRGIRVLPEFDAPAHVGNGFQWGELHGLGKLAVCVNREPWQSFCVEPPCGQLNLANPKMYDVLSSIYKEMVELFDPIDLFHYGGDEVNVNCWNTTQEMVDWMKSKGHNLTSADYYEEWANFQNKAFKLFNEANKKEVPGIIWTSHLTEVGASTKYLDPAKYIIQIWTTADDPSIQDLLKNNFKVIFSNYDSWYLDCGFGAWVGKGNNWCSPYKGWQKVYDNSPSKMAGTAHRHQVMGGEAALWSEQVDSSTIDSRIWPRGAALAERLWSDPEHDWKSAEYRLINQRQRLVQRGLRADRIQPQWCHQNEGLCYL